jgi:hypothetical protein
MQTQNCAKLMYYVLLALLFLHVVTFAVLRVFNFAVLRGNFNCCKSNIDKKNIPLPRYGS